MRRQREDPVTQRAHAHNSTPCVELCKRICAIHGATTHRGKRHAAAPDPDRLDLKALVGERVSWLEDLRLRPARANWVPHRRASRALPAGASLGQVAQQVTFRLGPSIQTLQFPAPCACQSMWESLARRSGLGAYTHPSGSRALGHRSTPVGETTYAAASSGVSHNSSSPLR